MIKRFAIEMILTRISIIIPGFAFKRESREFFVHSLDAGKITFFNVLIGGSVIFVTMGKLFL